MKGKTAKTIFWEILKIRIVIFTMGLVNMFVYDNIGLTKRLNTELLILGDCMKGLFLVLAMVMSLNVMAIDLLAHKSTGSSIVKIADSALETLWASNTPACLKDGSRLMGVNKAFRAKNLKYGDCSASDNAKEKQKLLGYEVAVVKFVELSPSMAKKVAGK